jgi:predicted CoA-binding protein
VDDHLERIIKRTRSIAVVGLSRDPNKISFSVARYLRSAGFTIIPVNPRSKEIMGLRCYRSLKEIPESVLKAVDMVNIFRRSEDIPPIIDEAVELRSRYGKPDTIWMQLGIVNDEAALLARGAGLEVVMDKCLRTEHQQFGLT